MRRYRHWHALISHHTVRVCVYMRARTHDSFTNDVISITFVCEELKPAVRWRERRTDSAMDEADVDSTLHEVALSLPSVQVPLSLQPLYRLFYLVRICIHRRSAVGLYEVAGYTLSRATGTLVHESVVVFACIQA
jgi:hypothetical protein